MTAVVHVPYRNGRAFIVKGWAGSHSHSVLVDCVFESCLLKQLNEHGEECRQCDPPLVFVFVFVRVFRFVKVTFVVPHR